MGIRSEMQDNTLQHTPDSIQQVPPKSLAEVTEVKADSEVKTSESRAVTRISVTAQWLCVMLKGDSWWYRVDLHPELFKQLALDGRKFTITGKKFRKNHYMATHWKSH